MERTKAFLDGILTLGWQGIDAGILFVVRHPQEMILAGCVLFFIVAYQLNKEFLNG